MQGSRKNSFQEINNLEGTIFLLLVLQANFLYTVYRLSVEAKTGYAQILHPQIANHLQSSGVKVSGGRCWGTVRYHLTPNLSTTSAAHGLHGNSQISMVTLPSLVKILKAHNSSSLPSNVKHN